MLMYLFGPVWKRAVRPVHGDEAPGLAEELQEVHLYLLVLCQRVLIAEIKDCDVEGPLPSPRRTFTSPIFRWP